jgi:hypothetical protein
VSRQVRPAFAKSLERCVCGVVVEWRGVELPARGGEEPTTIRRPFDTEGAYIGRRHRCRRSGPVRVRMATPEERIAFGIREPRQH